MHRRNFELTYDAAEGEITEGHSFARHEEETYICGGEISHADGVYSSSQRHLTWLEKPGKYHIQRHILKNKVIVHVHHLQAEHRDTSQLRSVVREIL